MSNSRTQADQIHQPATRSMRDAIALALDGALPSNDDATTQAYGAAMVPLAAAVGPRLQRLRLLSAAGLVAASARFDDTHRLLDALGVTPISTCAIPEDSSWPGVVVVGCLGVGDAAHSHWIERMLARGAVIVSSDMSAGVPLIANELNVDTGRPGRRARVAVGPDVADVLAIDADFGHLVAELHPAVRLAPGHLPLIRPQRADTQVIARDAMTGEPLIVLAWVGGGQVVHSVAHWWQDDQPDATELGHRSLASVPAFSALGLLYREARLGGFGAAAALLACLLSGLDIALNRVGSRLPLADISCFADGG